VGKERLKARRAEIRTYDKVGAAETAKKAVLENAQNEAESFLDAEAKLGGELLEGIPKKRNKESSTQGTSLPSLPVNITKKESHYAQTVSRNPEIIDQRRGLVGLIIKYNFRYISLIFFIMIFIY
jgi:hypothetical protein